MKSFLKFAGLFVLAIGGIIYSGYTLSVLWGWFIMTTFTAPALSIPAAIGITYVVRYLTMNKTKDAMFGTKEVEGRDGEYLFAHSFVVPTMFLLIGYIVKSFM